MIVSIYRFVTIVRPQAASLRAMNLIVWHHATGNVAIGVACERREGKSVISRYTNYYEWRRVLGISCRIPSLTRRVRKTVDQVVPAVRVVNQPIAPADRFLPLTLRFVAWVPLPIETAIRVSRHLHFRWGFETRQGKTHNNVKYHFGLVVGDGPLPHAATTRQEERSVDCFSFNQNGN